MSAIFLAKTYDIMSGSLSSSPSASTSPIVSPAILVSWPLQAWRPEFKLVMRSSHPSVSRQLSRPSLLLGCQPACPLILSFHIAQRVAWIFGLNLCKSVMQRVMHCLPHPLLSRENYLASVGCLRVEYRVQQCVHFHFAVFVTKCLGFHLLLTCNQEPRPVSRPSYHSVSYSVLGLTSVTV